MVSFLGTTDVEALHEALQQASVPIRLMGSGAAIGALGRGAGRVLCRVRHRRGIDDHRQVDLVGDSIDVVRTAYRDVMYRRMRARMGEMLPGTAPPRGTMCTFWDWNRRRCAWTRSDAAGRLKSRTMHCVSWRESCGALVPRHRPSFSKRRGTSRWRCPATQAIAALPPLMRPLAGGFHTR